MRLLRRYPAAAWIPVYVGSVFVLDGGQSRNGAGIDATQLAIGIALIVLALAVGSYLAFSGWTDRPAPRGLVWMYGGVLAFYVVCAVAAAIFTDTATAIAALAAGLIPLTAVSVWIAHTRLRSVGAPGAELDLAASDADDPIPSIGADAVRPVGDSPEVHDSIGPHDLPKDHPARRTMRRIRARSGSP